RNLLGLSPGGDVEWIDYFAARQRDNGSFNTTPAKDGSPGHVMNTLWGYLAADCIGQRLPESPGLIEWVRSCQLASGGFTYAPDAKLGAVDDLYCTWGALHLLKRIGGEVKDARKCADWIDSLFTPEGGYQDRPGGEPNPVATYYALESLSLLGH